MSNIGDFFELKPKIRQLKPKKKISGFHMVLC